MDWKLSAAVLLKCFSMALLALPMIVVADSKIQQQQSTDSTLKNIESIEAAKNRKVLINIKREDEEALVYLGDHYSVKPFFLSGDGKIMGYQIFPGENSESFDANGFLAGDIVTKVNGIPLTSKKYGIRVLRNAVKALTFDLVLLRNGIEIELYFVWDK